MSIPPISEECTFCPFFVIFYSLMAKIKIEKNVKKTEQFILIRFVFPLRHIILNCAQLVPFFFFVTILFKKY